MDIEIPTYAREHKKQMTKQDLIRTIVIVILAFLLIGLVFFGKEKENNIPERENNGNVPNIEENNKKTESAEEDKLKTMAENFAVIYYSYSWGNFSNIESLYPQMTDEMQDKEKNGVEKLKKDLENQPKQYITWRAIALGSEFVFKDKDKATIAVYLKISKFAGAIVQKDTMVWVDSQGSEYKGNENDLIFNESNKKFTIKFVRIDNEWKISDLGAK